MTSITDRERYERLNTLIWKKRGIDQKGRTVLPIKLRKILGISGQSKILWIEAKHHPNGKSNEFVIEVAVEP